MTDIEDLEKLLDGLIKKPLQDTLGPALEGVRKKIDDNLEDRLDPLRNEQEDLARALTAATRAADTSAKTTAATLTALQTSLDATANELRARLSALEQRANTEAATYRRQARMGLFCTIAAAPFTALLVILLEMLTHR